LISAASSASDSRSKADDLKQLVELMPRHNRTVVTNLYDANPGDEQMHEKILGFNRIVGEMRKNATVVLRKSNVIDGEFREHKGWLVIPC